MRRAAVACGALLMVASAAPAWACGGLVNPNGTVSLVRTTTLAGYRDGVEHYVTSFEFSGKGGGRFGSIVPLPDVPTDVRKGGRWTLERLALETQPPVARFTSAVAAGSTVDAEADVLMTARVEALKITVLQGGGDEVGLWAKEHGFSLPPDAPEVLDFYADRSPIFMAVRYDLQEARERDLEQGDGTPVHVTIPTSDPWVPLRILGLGKTEREPIDADVFLLTEREPSILPQAGPGSGMRLESSGAASNDLLRDLRSDRGMKWLPSDGMWLTYLRISATAGRLKHDLAIDVSGNDTPSAEDAGLLWTPGDVPRLPDDASVWWAWVLAAAVAAGTIAVTNRRASRT